MNMTESAACKYLTDKEIEGRIFALTAADCVRLERVAATYASGTGWSAGDLMQEALVAALERRQWRKDLETLVFLTGIMRSLAHARHKARRSAPLDRAMASGDETTDELEELNAGDEANPEEIASSEQELRNFVEQLGKCFEGDTEVLRVIQGRANGESPAAIKAALAMNQTQYETVCRRLLRGYQTRMKVMKV